MGLRTIHLERLLYLLPFAILVSGHGRFAACRATVEDVVSGKINNTMGWDPAIHEFTKKIKGFDYGAGVQRPITLTYEGCKHMCGGNAPDPNDIFTALSVLTTWVLPSVALFSNLPYEALSKKKYRKTFEAFTSWIGSPQTALTTTFFNIYAMRRCQLLSKQEPVTELLYRDVLYVLSCIGQYEYRTFGMDKSAHLQRIRERRDRALVYGILRPLTDSDERDVVYSRVLISNLAFQLRCNRRRGVFPVLINVTWFLVAFAFSLVTAFSDLGGNTTAHSLALGIFVSWLPVLVCSTVTDRNPTASTRCRVLINRWLYNNEAIYTCFPNSEPDWWHPPSKKLHIQGSIIDMTVDDFIGQGRRLRYCGVTSALLEIVENEPYTPISGFSFSDYHLKKSLRFQRTLTKRPISWWVICGFAHLFVTQQIFLAFVIAFNTPTIGLGCRSILYLLYFFISGVTTTVQVVFQEPPPWTRRITIPINALNTLLLLTIMLLQTTGGLNNCFCKTSQLGTGAFGGYTDLQNAQFYKVAFHVVRTWGPAAALGIVGCLGCITWNLRCWMKTSTLWQGNEDPKVGMEGGNGVDMSWLI